MEQQNNLTRLWEKYFDHIYCLHYIPFQNRMPMLEYELKRVGILQSTKFSFKYTFDSPFFEKLQKSDIHLSQETLKTNINAFKCGMGHYEVMKEAVGLGYHRILILEDDVRFLNDLPTLASILKKMPRDYDIVLFDSWPYQKGLCEQLQQECPVNEFYTNFKDSFNSAACYALSNNAMIAIIQQQETSMVVADDAYHNRDNDSLKRCFSNLNLCQQSGIGNIEKEKTLYSLYSLKNGNFHLYNQKTNVNVLIGCNFFQNLTGSEVYFYEITKALMKLGYDVTVASQNIGNGNLLNLAKKELKTNLPRIISINQLKEEGIKKYDIALVSHTDIVKTICYLKYKEQSDMKVINIIHGEYLKLEQPYVSEMVNYYIGIRPTIIDVLRNKYHIENCKLVWNPFDIKRFEKIRHPKIFDFTQSGATIFFCGTIDKLRKDSLYNIANECTEKKWKLLLVGKNNEYYLQDLINKFPCIEYHGETENIEEYLKMADATCGILIGRTTIEGWLCNLPGIVYQLDENYNIKGKEFWMPPKDYHRFDSIKVTQEILNTIR